MRFLAIMLLLVVMPASAHELWIEPVDYRPEPEREIVANLVNGERFVGSPLIFFEDWFHSFEIIAGDQAAPVTGRMGDMPAIQQEPLGEGLHVIIYHSSASNVTYKTLEKFISFARHKDFRMIPDQHLARKLPDSDFTEVYTRYSKTLIGIGHGKGQDSRTGLETEIVALDNPYTDNPDIGLRIEVLYQNKPRANAQVELFEKDSTGTVDISLHRTDEAGIATLPVRKDHSYMVDAVVLRKPNAELAEETGAVWETLWANLTFYVPE
jgi:hypothetical protein